MQFIDYYEVMGVEPDASGDEIKRTYRKLARKYHPDVSKEADASEKFKAVGEAYGVLKDKEKRTEYDQLRAHAASGQGDFSPPPGWRPGAGAQAGSAGWQPSQGNPDADFSDFFREIFGDRATAGAQGQGGYRQGPGSAAGHGSGGQPFSMRGQDVDSSLNISIRDAFDGVSLPLALRVPVWHDNGTMGVDEKTLQVRIPKGVRSGQRIRLRGQGGPGVGGGKAGDLYIELTITPHKDFQLDGRDVTLVLPVMPWEAALGAALMVPTLGGEVKLRIPERSSAGRKLRLKGRGLPGDPPGDQYVVLRIDTPMPDTDEQQALYREMSKLWADADPRKAVGE